jgi:hypothetical protein
VTNLTTFHKNKQYTTFSNTRSTRPAPTDPSVRVTFLATTTRNKMMLQAATLLGVLVTVQLVNAIPAVRKPAPFSEFSFC